MKKILRGFRREETARFVAFRSHWQFEASFCTPGEGHEKGGVEGEVGYVRRNHFVPVLAARDLEALNAMLLAGCREDEARIIDGREQTVGEASAIERQHLLPMAREGFDLVEVSFGQVNGLGCVKVRTNAYSAPLLPGTQAQIKLSAATVEVWYAGRCVARQRALVRSSPAGARPGALPGRARAQAGRIRWQQTPGAVASSWSLASEQ